jgi:integrase
MTNPNGLQAPAFTGPLAGELREFLLEKRRTGHKYHTESYHLVSIDRLSVERCLPPGALPKEFVDLWSQKRETESKKTWCNRVAVVRQLAKYLSAHGCQAYESQLVVASKRKSNFVPHIYTDSELRRIFTQADRCMSYTNCPNRNAVISLLFRLVYACGLRISEARCLEVKDVDLDNGVLAVLDSKFGVNRYVPMSPQLTVRCHGYYKAIHQESLPDVAFFPAPNGGAYSERAVCYTFHQILSAAGIPRTGGGPRIHDLRHTFAVNCLKKWVHEGKDLTAALPVLSAYLGHKSLNGTQDYLRLTADMFPDITAAVEKRFGDVVPKGGTAFEEL